MRRKAKSVTEEVRVVVGYPCFVAEVSDTTSDATCTKADAKKCSHLNKILDAINQSLNSSYARSRGPDSSREGGYSTVNFLRICWRIGDTVK